MPAHNIHMKWAEKLGLFKDSGLLGIFECAKVDCMIDSPESYLNEFKSLKERWNEGLRPKMKHDYSRVDKEVMRLYLDLMERKGNDYVKAFFLHHLLDALAGQNIIEDRKSLLIANGNSGQFEGDFLKIIERHGLMKEYEEVLSFVRKNINEILQDLENREERFYP